MIDNYKIAAIIPARGGSKGVPHKNIKKLNGKPLISYTIEGAKESKYLDRIIVSTEDKHIASISKAYKAEVPFLRPLEIAGDTTPGIDPIIHCINWLKENEKYNADYVVCLQCTSPFRRIQQIDEALEKLINENVDSIVSVCESEVTPYWMKKIEKNRLIDFLDDTGFYARRQETPKVYRLNGAIYAAKTEILLKYKNWYTENTIPYIMDRLTSLDIDDIVDFKFAEFLMREKEND